jgi:alpha-tubulin suppressor-like RCC1 family protein
VGANWLLDEPQRTPAIPRRAVDRATVEDDVTLLAAGTRFACFMKKAEAVECLGVNVRGQLGNGLTGDGETAPVPLPLPPQPAPPPIVKALTAGGAHGCAALWDGRLRCWGANDVGQLGNDKTVDPGLGILATPLGR